MTAVRALCVRPSPETGTGAFQSRLPRKTPDQVRRIGDLNPGGWLHPTALAARGTAVPIGSSWTNPPGRSSLDGAAPR
jgi:hypothetical protein